MTAEVLTINATPTANEYQVTAKVNSEEHTFFITVDDALAPMLGISGDDALYQVFGQDIGLYRPILQMVGKFHAGSPVDLPCIVERVLPTARLRYMKQVVP